MTKLIRILAVVVVTGAFAFVAAPPAFASHDTGDGATPTAPHEHPPSPAVVDPRIPCVVAGEVLPGATGGTPHTIPTGQAIPGFNASHTHYTFVDSLIGCTDIDGILVGVDADGGNDGHFVDPLGLPGSLWHHQFNADHGSTNESGWSHCSGYSGGCTEPEAESNVCDNNADNKNKGDISTGDGSTGWVKYIRVGVVLYVWGCFDSPGSAAVAANPYFSAVLAIFPPSVLTGGFNNLPFCLIPENTVTGVPPSCGFSIAGVAFRGPGWLIDEKPVTDFLHCLDGATPLACSPPTSGVVLP